MRAPVLAPAVVLALSLGVADARAQLAAPDTAQLEYVIPEGAGCPAEWAFRAMVAGGLGGRDPFTPEAPRRIAVTLRRSSRGGFVGVASERNAAGKWLGEREMRSSTCVRIAESMSIVLTSWLMPILRPRTPAPPVVAECAPAPAPGPPVSAPPAPVCAPAPEAPHAEPAPRPLLVVELGSLMSLATVPRRPGFGVVGAVGLRWPSFSFALEARADLPSATEPQSLPLGATYGSAWIVSGTAAPCLHAKWFVGCALGSGGTLRKDHAWAGGHHAGVSVPYAAVGARAGVEVPLSSRWALRASADLLGSLIHQNLTIADGFPPMWTLPTAEGAVGLRLVATFGGP